MIQFGWNQLIGDGTAEIEGTVVFPTAFGTALFILAGAIGANVGAAAADITGLDTVHSPSAFVETQDLTTTGFNYKLSLSSGTFGSSDYHAMSWIVIGVKS